MPDKPGFGENLTERELEICKMIAKGLSREQIAKILFLAEGTIKNHIASIYEKTGARNRVQLAARYIVYGHAKTDVSAPAVTIDTDIQADAILRLVGLPGLPEVIPLALGGQPFVIGRFDLIVGQKQCDFEFALHTKAVSRRHASFERTTQGVAVVDLRSLAGTFINGDRILSGEPYPIKQGDRISFGGMGADYIFEDNGWD